MPRIDDYKQAFEIGKKNLADKDPKQLAIYAGAKVIESAEGKISLSIDFLNQEIISPWPDIGFINQENKEELSIQQQIIIVHYLNGIWESKGIGVRNDWIAFQEVPDGRFYLDPFLKRAKVPLVNTFGDKPDLLIEVASEMYKTKSSDHGDVSVIIQALPLVPINLIIWKGDDEFPPDGNILFDKNIYQIFSAEDIAWLAGMVVYPMIGMAMKKG